MKRFDVNAIDSIASRTPQCSRNGSAFRHFFLLASFATVWMGLAVAGMAQVPSERLTSAAGEEMKAPQAAPSPPQCPRREMMAGNKDAFSPSGVEIAMPSATLKSTVGGPFANFDGTAQDVHFAHTFQLPRCGCIVGAKLEFLAKALGTSGSSSSGNDSLTLGFSTLSGFPRWGAWLGTGPSTAPSLSSPAWGSPPLQRTFTLDLAALPVTGGTTISLLSAMQTNRYLDFYVQDDTSIDYIKLTVTLCDCTTCGRGESSNPQ